MLAFICLFIQFVAPIKPVSSQLFSCVLFLSVFVACVVAVVVDVVVVVAVVVVVRLRVVVVVM